MKVKILGEEWKIQDDDSLLKDGCDGICTEYGREIRLVPAMQMLDDADAEEQKKQRYRQVKRHELIHAFFSEAGLNNYSNDELLVDWIAAQFPKLNRLFSEAGCLD